MSRWNPTDTLPVSFSDDNSVAHRLPQGFPSFLGLAKVGGIDFVYFNDPNPNVIPENGHYNCEVGYMTMPADFDMFTIDGSQISGPQEGGSVECTIPVLLYLERRSNQVANSPSPPLGSGHICDKFSDRRIEGTLACSTPVRGQINSKDLIVFKNSKAKDKPIKVAKEELSADENEYIIPIFLSNQNICFVIFNAPSATDTDPNTNTNTKKGERDYINKWDEIKNDANILTSCMAEVPSDATITYSDSHDIWIANQAVIYYKNAADDNDE